MIVRAWEEFMPRMPSGHDMAVAFMNNQVPAQDPHKIEPVSYHGWEMGAHEAPPFPWGLWTINDVWKREYHFLQ